MKPPLVGDAIKDAFSARNARPGILFSGSQFISLAHDDGVIERTVAAYDQAMRVLRFAIDNHAVDALLQGQENELIFRRSKLAERIVLGAAGLGMAYGRPDANGEMVQAPDEGMVQSVLAAAWDIGIRRVDTAPAYGQSEELIGKYWSGRCGLRSRDQSALMSRFSDSSARPLICCNGIIGRQIYSLAVNFPSVGTSWVMTPVYSNWA